MAYRLVRKQKAKRELIEKIRGSGKKIGENDYIHSGRRFVVSGRHFLVYRDFN